MWAVPPELSVVIVNYNTRQLLDSCLQSLFEQTLDHSMEVIVTDNASSDKSCEMLRERFPSVYLIENNENRGFARGVNEGIQVSRGRLILLLNPDTIILDHAIDRMVDFIDGVPLVGACCPMLRNEDGTYQRGTQPLPVLFSPLYQFSSLFERNPALARVLLPDWLDNPSTTHLVGYSSGACLLVKRACINEVGLLDENFFLYGEDVDWCQRMWNAGWQVVYFAGSSVLHHEGGSQAPDLTRRLREFNGELQYLRKWHGRTYTAGFMAIVWLCSLLRYIRLHWRQQHSHGEHGQLLSYLAFYRAVLLGKFAFARPTDSDGDPRVLQTAHKAPGRNT
jgi:GT2 family glycosyltransferase